MLETTLKIAKILFKLLLIVKTVVRHTELVHSVTGTGNADCLIQQWIWRIVTPLIIQL